MRQRSETEKVMFTANEILYKQEGIQALQALHCNCGVTLLNEPSQTLGVCPLLKRQSSYAQNVCDQKELPKTGLCRSATVSISEKELYLAAGLACQQWSGCSAD